MPKRLPPRMRALRKSSGRTYYYYDAGGTPRKSIPLGSNFLEAMRQWAELEGADTPREAVYTFKSAADRYRREVIPAKAVRTQRDNLTELDNLLAFFNDPPAPLDEIKPKHIRQYLDQRGEKAKTRANREKALFSHIFNKARAWGMTDAENPCRGVEGFAEAGRDIYVEDWAFEALWAAASQPVRDAMDLAYLTGQRPADIMKMRETDVREGALWVKQGKRGRKLRIAVEGALKALLDRIEARKRNHKVRSLALAVDEHGRALSYAALDNRWEHIRERAAKAQEAEGRGDRAAELRRIQFRDLRAKAGTDKESAAGMAAAKDQLGHAAESTTVRYVRHRLGKLVTPTK